MRKILFILWGLCLLATANAEEQTQADSLKAMNDSLVSTLRSQVQELQMQSIMMRAQLERSGKYERDEALRKARIDSLRAITAGSPVVVEGDTLFFIYTRKGGMLPETRAQHTAEAIETLGKRISFFTDSIYAYEGDISTDIMAGDDVIISITDNDALWQNTTRQALAADYCTIIQNRVKDLQADYGLKQKMLGGLVVLVILAIQAFLIWGTNWLYNRWRLKLLRRLMRRTTPLSVKTYEVLNPHQQGIVFAFIFNCLRYLAIFLQLLVSIPLLFSAFPETKSLTYTVFGYIWNPVTDIASSVVGFLPNLFKIVIIVLCFRYLVKGIRYVLDEIASGKLKVNGFYADWAQPTFVIVRLLCYSFMLVMVWPLLPSSNSEVFQGVSVFIGIIVSLGSSSIIGNIMAGMVMTYMRPFRLGDFIKFGDVQGTVIEKTVLVTRIKTLKNEVITIPNSNLLGSQTSNFTFAAQNYGIIVHTKVTIGYDMQWPLIQKLLLAAAKATPHIQRKPEPFVRVTALDDFYVEYEINAFTRRQDLLSDIYSSLHQHILDEFHTNGVEIMSPHIFAHRSDLELQIPKEQQQ